jgi:hypothetical protein
MTSITAAPATARAEHGHRYDRAPQIPQSRHKQSQIRRSGWRRRNSPSSDSADDNLRLASRGPTRALNGFRCLLHARRRLARPRQLLLAFAPRFDPPGPIVEQHNRGKDQNIEQQAAGKFVVDGGSLFPGTGGRLIAAAGDGIANRRVGLHILHPMRPSA